MHILDVIILGLVEGLTEFLPISSTGHLILVERWLGVDSSSGFWATFRYFIQIGAILAVVVYFARPILRQICTVPRGDFKDHLLFKLVIGVLPAVVFGLWLDKVAEKYLEWSLPVAAALIVGAGLMIWIERRFRRETGPTIEQVTWKQSLLIGLAQCVAIIPGTSRAMATIMGGLMVGLPAATAAEFSFYLAIPTLCGAGLLRLVKHRHEIFAGDAVLLIVGFAVAFVVALITVAGFMRYIQTRKLKPFAYYRVVLGLIVLWFWWNPA